MEISNFRSSIDPNDIENVMEIVKTYGGNDSQTKLYYLQKDLTTK